MSQDTTELLTLILAQLPDEELARLQGELDERGQTVEQWLREGGFTGKDRLGRQWVNGRLTKSTDDEGGGSSGHTGADRAAGVAKIQSTVDEMGQTPEGKQALEHAQTLAGRIKEGIASGVKKVLDAVDEKTGGGISLIATGGAKGFATGIGHVVSSVLECVHQEVFEAALGQHFAPGAAIVGKSAAYLASQAQSALAWALAKVSGARRQTEGRLLKSDLTDGDRKLLAGLADVAVEQLGLAGIDADRAKLAGKIEALLRKEE